MATLVQRLTSCDFKRLHQRRGDGQRHIDSLFESLPRHSSNHVDIIERYHAVFDACLDLDFGCWLIDFVEEVCGDPLIVSSDPIESQLLDAGFVAAWSRQTIARIEAEVIGALKSEQRFQQLQSRVHKELCKVSVIANVLEALERIRLPSSLGGVEGMAASRCGASRTLHASEECVFAPMCEPMTPAPR